MSTSLSLAWGLTIRMAAWALTGGKELPLQGVLAGLGLLQEVWLPLLFSFILAGLFEVLISRELLVNWMGEESGLQDILVVWLVGLAETMRDVYRLPRGRLALEGRDGGRATAYIHHRQVAPPHDPDVHVGDPVAWLGLCHGQDGPEPAPAPDCWPYRSATLRPVSSIMRPSLQDSPRR